MPYRERVAAWRDGERWCLRHSRELVRLAECRKVAGVYFVGNDVETLAYDAALELCGQ